MGVNKVVVNTMLIIIPIAAVLFFIYLSWRSVPVDCWEDLNGSKNAVLSSLRKCVDKCWSKHDFGSEPIIDDCYTISLWIKDREISIKDIEGLNDNVKSYLDPTLLERTQYRIKIKYNYTGNEISFVNVGVCGNRIPEESEFCDSDISTCKPSDFSYGNCTALANRYCSGSCTCVGELDCNICTDEMPTEIIPNTNTDWCRFCKSETERGNCRDKRDNDCDGLIDNDDKDDCCIVDYPIIDYPSNNYDSRGTTVIDSVVVHYTAGPLNAALGWLTRSCSGSSCSSAHYVLSKDGTVYKLVDENRRAWHATVYNSRSVGIEVVNAGFECGKWGESNCVKVNGQAWEPYPDEQIRVLAELTADIIIRHPNILPDRNHIIGHNEVSGSGKVDPGPLFPWGEFMRLVNEYVDCMR